MRLLLTSDDGYLYIYGMDIQEGGDCHLIRQFLLTNATEAGITEAELARQVNENSHMSWLLLILSVSNKIVTSIDENK